MQPTNKEVFIEVEDASSKEVCIVRLDDVLGVAISPTDRSYSKLILAPNIAGTISLTREDAQKVHLLLTKDNSVVVLNNIKLEDI